MKIAVSSSKGSLDANVDSRFGRCPYYIIFEIEGKEIKNHEILENAGAQGLRGVGITGAQMVANKGVEVIITGNIGPNAFNVLSSTGIKIISGVSGNVRKVVEKYLKGKLKETKQSTISFDPGIGGGRGSGRGRWNR